jgi:hypothetical protein
VNGVLGTCWTISLSLIIINKLERLKYDQCLCIQCSLILLLHKQTPGGIFQTPSESGTEVSSQNFSLDKLQDQMHEIKDTMFFHEIFIVDV